MRQGEMKCPHQWARSREVVAVARDRRWQRSRVMSVSGVQNEKGKVGMVEGDDKNLVDERHL
jgi:hypothetical protein